MNPASRCVWFGAGAMIAAAGAVCHAQNGPARTIRMRVDFPPGGSIDGVERIVGEKVAKDAGLKAD